MHCLVIKMLKNIGSNAFIKKTGHSLKDDGIGLETALETACESRAAQLSVSCQAENISRC